MRFIAFVLLFWGLITISEQAKELNNQLELMDRQLASISRAVAK